MKNRTLLLILLLSLFTNFELQAQKRYFNVRNEPLTQLDTCSYYEITYYDTLDPNKKFVEIYTCSDKLLKIVPFYYNQIDGTVISFDSLGKRIKEENYMNGLKNGISKKYWSNGKLRRQELFLDDKFTSGKCFDEAEKEVQYLSSDRELKFSRNYPDILDYLIENMKYPREDREKGITGKVRISFTINEIGKVEDIVVIDKVSPTIDAEATRLIKQLPIESPEVRDDIPVSVKYVMPIIFSFD